MTGPRITRANSGVYTTAMASAALRTPGPSMAAMAIASNSAGKHAAQHVTPEAVGSKAEVSAGRFEPMPSVEGRRIVGGDAAGEQRHRHDGQRQGGADDR